MISVNMLLDDLCTVYTNVIYSFDETLGHGGFGTCCYADFTFFVIVISYMTYVLVFDVRSYYMVPRWW